MTNTETLFNLIPKLSAVEFAGLARVLKVKLYSEEKDENGRFIPRPFTDVLNNIIKNFEKQNRTRKREILQVVKKAVKKPLWHPSAEENVDASDSKNT